uniref:Uncharacterized protein n=1 Tax=viral metagenome TaxID=1070528 RepID=A0A6C0HEG0_9ZZZZ
MWGLDDDNDCSPIFYVAYLCIDIILILLALHLLVLLYMKCYICYKKHSYQRIENTLDEEELNDIHTS